MNADKTSVEAEIEKLNALREEHAPIEERIRSDAGMAPETRRVLLEHLHEEEQEHLERIARESPEAAAKLSGQLTPVSPRVRTGATVGSLRRPVSTAPAPRGTVGSLRRDCGEFALPDFSIPLGTLRPVSVRS